MKIRFNKTFSKQYDKAPKIIQTFFENKIKVFQQNPFELQLNNHSLSGKFAGYRSINITGDWRAIYLERKEDKNKVIIFTLLGTHSQLYK